MKNNLKPQNYNILPKQDGLEAGGKQKGCDFLKQDLGQTVECQPQDFGEEMADIEYIEKFKLENPRILNPSDYQTTDEFLDALEKWYIRRIGKKSTFMKRKNLLSTMVNHPIFPIDIMNLNNPDQIDAQFEYDKQHYNKDTNRNGKDSIINKYKALKTVAQAININTDNWNLIIPERGKPKHKIIPLPQTVYNLIHHKYTTDPYENALWGHIAFQGFLIGFRPVSEMPIMKLKDIHIDDGYIHFYQPKVDNWRMTAPEKDIMSMDTRKSYKNWIDHWRPKVENQYSKNFVYLQPNGKPFTQSYFKKQINDIYKQVYPDFHPYCMRNWCAIARMISSKVQTGNFDVYSVSDFFNHSNISVTQSYVLDSNKYYKMKPINWINAVLKSNKFKKEFVRKENSLIPVNRKPRKKGLYRLKSLRETGINPSGSVTSQQEKNKSIKPRFWGVSDFLISLKAFFFGRCLYSSQV